MNKKLIGLLLLVLSCYGFSQNVIISPDSSAIPHVSAILELRSNNKGFLPPRLTETERNTIVTPALGLMIFNTTANKMQWYDGGKWSNIDGSATKSPTELLTAQDWKIQEIRYVHDNTAYYYKRGAVGNTDNFDNERIKFNTYNTGTYYRNNLEYSLTWNFVNAEKTKLVMDINFPTPLHINWEHILLNEHVLKYTEHYIFLGNPNLTVANRIPINYQAD